jgi:hypothetical protein
MTSKVTRKQFLQTSLCLVGGSAVGISGVAGCGDDDGNGTGGTSGSSGGTSGAGGTRAAAGTGGTRAAAGTGGTRAAAGTGGTRAAAGTGETSEDGGVAGTSGAAGTGGTAGGGVVTSCSTDVAIAEEHTHTLMVPAADAAADAAKTYTTGVTAGHTHMITITASEFQTLLSGQSVMKPTTTVEAHAHEVTVMCM